jgi:cytochrome c-type biogenesis protein CcmH/NrfG
VNGLVDQGKIEAGMAMLQEVMKHDPSEFDRAICACFLALGEIKQGNLSKAKEWIQLAQKLDPNCGALPRIESRLRPPFKNPPGGGTGPAIPANSGEIL